MSDDFEAELSDIVKEEIKIENICPVIGMISSGKSSILNALFNINLLEANSDVTTKIVTMIRYSKYIKNEPIFYKLSLEKDGNNNYKFFKEDIEIKGNEKIKQKIEELNKKLSQTIPKYEDIFYMLELGKVNSIDKEFLEHYVLADIPGVSENIKQNQKNEININNSGFIQNEEKINKIYDFVNLNTEEELINYNLEKEINYLTQIFKIIKNKMKNGIFIFSVDKFQLTENYKIIGKLRLILDKPLENYLILLNKMDISENIEEDIKSLIAKFIKEFPNGGFNYTRNIIVPCCSFQLENELNIDKAFTYFLYRQYINYIFGSNKYANFIEFFKVFIKNNMFENNISIESETFKDNIKSMLDKKYLDNIKTLIQKIKTNHDINKYNLLFSEKDFDEKYINDCLDELEEDVNGNINLFEQTNNNIIILYYYYLYKNKKILIFESSEQTQKILNYFTLKNMNRDFGNEEAQMKLNELENKIIYEKNIEHILNLINNFNINYEKEGINLNLREGFKNSINPIIKVLKTSKMFFIPLIGLSNSGKSTILNDLIGYNILPTKQGECTKVGILVKNWDYEFPIIRKAKFIIENFGNDNAICYFKINNNIITQGYENIKSFLENLNYKYEENEENFFYIINVKVSFLDIFEFDEKIKEKICFVDLPGYGTNNKFEEKNIYSLFIKSCKLFLMVTKDNFEERTNIEKINNLISVTSEYQNISKQSLIKKFFFIINYSKGIDLTQDFKIKKTNALMENINGLSENSFNYLNITFCNALSYEYYLTNELYFNSLDYMIKKEDEKYLKEKDNYQKLKRLISPGTFDKFLLSNLKDKLKVIFDKNFKDIKTTEIDKEIKIEKALDDYFESKNYQKSNKYSNNINDIKTILSYGKNNIKKNRIIYGTDFSNFTNNLFRLIITSKSEADAEIKMILKNNMNNLKRIFYNDNIISAENPIYKLIEEEPELKLEQFNNEINNKINQILSEQVKKNIPEIFEDCIKIIMNRLLDLSANIEQELKKENLKEVLIKFQLACINKINQQKGIIVLNLEALSDNVKKYYNEAFDIINKFKNYHGNNYEFYELKIYISNRLGDKKDYKEAISNIINDILSDSKVATNWKNSSGIFDYLKSLFSDKAYLNKTIDFIIKNTSERLKCFSNIISKLIKEYIDILLNIIDIEKNSIINYLEEQIRIKNNTNNELKEEEKKKKWNILCQEFNNLEEALAKFISDL